jgi:oligosaccharide repeat unit polymerase
MHALLYSAVWTLCLCLSHAALDGSMQPMPATTLILVAAWWAFLLGSIIPFLGRRARYYKRAMEIGRVHGLMVLYFLLSLQWAGVIYELSHLQGVAWSSGPTTIIANLARMRVTGETAEIQLPPFLGSFRWSHVIYIPLSLILRTRRLISRRHLLVIFALAGISALLHFTRAPVVQLSIVTLVAWLVLYRPTPKIVGITCVSIGGALLVTFVLSQIVIDRQSNTTASLDQSLAAYFGMSPLGYEEILSGRYQQETGIYSLDWLYFPLSKLGLVDSYPGLTRPYVYYPVVTNVYTYLDAFTLDGGVLGAISGACLAGFGCSCIYKSNRRQSTLYTLSFYSYLCYCCLMTPINNEFIRANTWIIMGVAWLATRFIRKHSMRRVRRRIQATGAFHTAHS